MDSDIIIKIDNISKIYQLYDKPVDRMREALSIVRRNYHRDFAVIDDLSLEIHRGESVGFVGENGAGKSTLLKIIAGVLNPTSGKVTIRGRIAALLELGAGFNMDYTGRENIFLNGRMMGYSRSQMADRLEEVIKFADIGEFIDQPVKTYSSGMFARLAFAVSINVEPEILIVDEILSVGDTRFQIKCINKMKELKSRGITILFVSHATEQIKRFCGRTIWMEDGRIKLDGEASEVVDLYDNYMRTGLDVDELLRKNDFNEDINEDINEGINEEDGFSANCTNNLSPSSRAAFTSTSKESAVNSDTGGASDREDRKNSGADKLALIESVKLNQNRYHTFDEMIAEVTYKIHEEEIPNFLLGVAIYSADRSEYVFGPNTYLEKIYVPNERGAHKVRYHIASLPLIRGSYTIDVGLFTDEGLVNLDYKMNAQNFIVNNRYFSEGTYYMNHTWEVID